MLEGVGGCHFCHFDCTPLEEIVLVSALIKLVLSLPCPEEGSLHRPPLCTGDAKPSPKPIKPTPFPSHPSCTASIRGNAYKQLSAVHLNLEVLVGGAARK